MSSSAIKIWLYPNYSSNILRHSKHAVESTNIFVICIEYSFLDVALFKSLKSIHTLIVPFFFITSIMFANHST